MELAILGVDGLEPSLVDEWRDVLPTLDSLMRTGCYSRIRSADPPFTAPAWPDIYTGKQSGKHGVFGFTKSLPGSYDRVPVNYNDVRAESLWEALDVAGVSCGAVNVPLSYPPSELEHGYVVAGWPVPNRVRVTSPPGLEDEIERHLGGTYEVNPYPLTVEFDILDEDTLADRIREGLRHRADVFEFLLEEHPVDVFFGVFMGIDVASHNFAWDRERLCDLYMEQDSLLGDVLDVLPDEVDIVILSDHGHAAKGAWSFHVNGWLRDEGYLATRSQGETPLLGRLGITQRTYARLRRRLSLGDLHRRLPQPVLDWLKRHVPQSQTGSRGLDTAAVDWSTALAYSPAQNRIYVNNLDKSEGFVSPDQRDELVDELVDALTAVPHPANERDEPLMSSVYRGDELYHGPHASKAPDIVFIADEMRCNAPMSLPDGDVFTDARWGEHRQYGLLVTNGPSFDGGGFEAESADIKDIFPLALALVDAAIPEDVDGSLPDDRVADALEATFRESRDQTVEAGSYTESESEAIEEQLEGLGYLE